VSLSGRSVLVSEGGGCEGDGSSGDDVVGRGVMKCVLAWRAFRPSAKCDVRRVYRVPMRCKNCGAYFDRNADWRGRESVRDARATEHVSLSRHDAQWHCPYCDQLAGRISSDVLRAVEAAPSGRSRPPECGELIVEYAQRIEPTHEAMKCLERVVSVVVIVDESLAYSPAPGADYWLHEIQNALLQSIAVNEQKQHVVRTTIEFALVSLDATSGVVRTIEHPKTCNDALMLFDTVLIGQAKLSSIAENRKRFTSEPELLKASLQAVFRKTLFPRTETSKKTSVRPTQPRRQQSRRSGGLQLALETAVNLIETRLQLCAPKRAASSAASAPQGKSGVVLALVGEAGVELEHRVCGTLGARAGLLNIALEFLCLPSHSSFDAIALEIMASLSADGHMSSIPILPNDRIHASGTVCAKVLHSIERHLVLRGTIQLRASKALAVRSRQLAKQSLTNFAQGYADPDAAFLLEVCASSAFSGKELRGVVQLASTWSEHEELSEPEDCAHAHFSELLVTRVVTMQFDLANRSEGFAASLCAPNLVALDIAKSLVAAHVLPTRNLRPCFSTRHSLDDTELARRISMLSCGDQRDAEIEREASAALCRDLSTLVQKSQLTPGANYARAQEILTLLEGFASSALVQRRMHLGDAHALRSLFCSNIDPTIAIAMMAPAMYVVLRARRTEAIEADKAKDCVLWPSEKTRDGEDDTAALHVLQVRADQSSLHPSRVVLFDAGVELFVWKGSRGKQHLVDAALEAARHEARRRKPPAQVHSTGENGAFERSLLCLLLPLPPSEADDTRSFNNDASQSNSGAILDLVRHFAGWVQSQFDKRVDASAPSTRGMGDLQSRESFANSGRTKGKSMQETEIGDQLDETV